MLEASGFGGCAVSLRQRLSSDRIQPGGGFERTMAHLRMELTMAVLDAIRHHRRRWAKAIATVVVLLSVAQPSARVSDLPQTGSDSGASPHTGSLGAPVFVL